MRDVPVDHIAVDGPQHSQVDVNRNCSQAEALQQIREERWPPLRIVNGARQSKHLRRLVPHEILVSVWANALKMDKGTVQMTASPVVEEQRVAFASMRGKCPSSFTVLFASTTAMFASHKTHWHFACKCLKTPFTWCLSH